MESRGNLKKRIKRGQTVFGSWLLLPSASVADLISSTGIDFLVIDMEHGPMDFHMAEGMVNAITANNSTALIRPSKNEQSMILRALDIGASGVVVPHIESAACRRQAISYIKYPPIGERGFSPYTKAAGYLPGNLSQYTKKENDSTLSVLMVEGVEGVENLADIADDSNIDVIYLGVYDLSSSLGIPGKVNDIRVKRCLEKCVKITRKRKIAFGSFVHNRREIKAFKDIGVQFITYMVDTAIFKNAYENIIKEYRSSK